VLDRSRQPHGEVELRRHDLAGLADREVVGRPPGVDDRARGANRAAERVRARLDEVEVLRPLEAAAAGDDDARVRQIRAVDFVASNFRNFVFGAPACTLTDTFCTGEALPAGVAAPKAVGRTETTLRRVDHDVAYALPA
jgi:hypothetical protein